ncbi:MAG: hypothetical protein WDA06_04065 [Phenylobacterium sp.]
MILPQLAEHGEPCALAAAFDAFCNKPHPGWLKRGRLADDHWVVELDNPRLRRNASVTLRFDVPVAPDLLLTDPKLFADLLTAKLYVYSALEGPGRWVRTSTTIREEYLGFLSFLRWRLGRGLPSMAHLRRTWFEEFCESLEGGGLEGLQRSEAAVASFISRQQAEGQRPPAHSSDAGIFSIEEAVRRCGFASARQISDIAAKSLADWAASHAMRLSRSLETRLSNPTADREYAGQSLERYLRVWERLGRIQDKLAHDPPGFLPFATRADSVRLAGKIGRALGRTPTAPAMQTCVLIDRALRWVLFYADDLKALVDEVRLAQAAERKAPKGWKQSKIIDEIWRGPAMRHVHRVEALGAPRLPRADVNPPPRLAEPVAEFYMRMLPAACSIVIAAFSARRAEEIFSLKDDCLETINGEPWLRTYVGKSLRGRDRIPAPSAVVKAIETLKWLSSEAREASGEGWLFQTQHPFDPSRRVVSPDLGRGLTAFAREMKLPAQADGSQWSFTPHQFRRFFAVVYYYRYRYRSLTVLSQYLLHYDPDSTRTYVTEARLGGFLKMVDQARADLDGARRAHQQALLQQQEFEDVGAELRMEVFRGALDGSERLSGWAGVRLLGELQKARAEWEARVDIGDYGDEAPTLDDLLVEFAKGKRLEPNPLGHSYCSCRHEEKDLSVAGCIIEAKRRDPNTPTRQGPDLRFAADLTCAACVHNVQLEENRAYWEKLVQSARTSCASCPGTILRQKMLARLEAAEAHLAKFHPGSPP